MAGNEPLVSIIMNCYNSATYLKEALESVINQTYKNWELIFWDNQSTDNSAKIVADYNDNRIRYFYAEEFFPLSRARQEASKKIQGQFIAFIDCDDIWLPEKLALQVEEFNSQPSLGLVYANYELLLENSDEPSVQRQADYYKKIAISGGHKKKNIFNELLLQNTIIFSSVMIKASAFSATRGFHPEFKQNEDYDILLQIAEKNDAACVDAVLLKYRIHATNNSYANAERSFLENEKIFAALPQSTDVRKASARNEVRYLMFKVVYLKKYASLFNFLNVKYWPFVYGILKQRIT